MALREESIGQGDGDYPPHEHGSKLVIGMVPPERHDEPVPLDLPRAILSAVDITRKHIQPHFPDAPATIRVFGTLPRRLADRNLSVRHISLVIGDITRISEELRTLMSEETRQATRVDLIADNLLADRDDVIVQPSSSELWSHPARASIIQGHTTAKANFGTLLDIKNGANRGRRRFLDALLALLPDVIKKATDADDDELQIQANYALFELLEIMRTIVEGRTLLLHFEREKEYLHLLEAYMDRAFGGAEAAALVRNHVRMPQEVDGLRLPTLNKKAKDKDLRVRRSESYRVLPGQEEQKLFLYPRESVDAMQAKLGPYPQSVQASYLNHVVMILLDLVKKMGGSLVMDSQTRSDLKRLLPNDVFEANEEAKFDDTVRAVLQILDDVVLTRMAPLFDDLDMYDDFSSEMRTNTREASPTSGSKPPEVVTATAGRGPRIGIGMVMSGRARSGGGLKRGQ